MERAWKRGWEGDKEKEGRERGMWGGRTEEGDMIGWEGEMERQEKDKVGARRVGHCTKAWREDGAQEKRWEGELQRSGKGGLQRVQEVWE